MTFLVNWWLEDLASCLGQYSVKISHILFRVLGSLLKKKNLLDRDRD